MNPTRLAWAAAACALLAFAVLEAVKYGGVATAVIVAFALLPDVALIGAFAKDGSGRLKPERVHAYNAVHMPWPPTLLVAIGALVWALSGHPEVVLAGLAWLAHIAVDRAVGYGLRAPDGTVQPVGRTRQAA